MSTLGDALRAVAAGDRQAMGPVYDASSSFAWKLALCLVGDQDRAYQVVLAAYGEVWARADEGVRSPLSPLTWVLAMVQQSSRDSPPHMTEPAATGVVSATHRWLLGLRRHLATALTRPDP